MSVGYICKSIYFTSVEERKKWRREAVCESVLVKYMEAKASPYNIYNNLGGRCKSLSTSEKMDHSVF